MALLKLKFGEWDESKHPRKGGKFAPKGTGDSGGGETKPAAKEAPEASSSSPQSTPSSGGGQISATTQKALAAKGFTKAAGDQAQKTFDRIKDSSPDAKAVTKEAPSVFSMKLQFIGRSALAGVGGALVGVGAFALANAVAPNLPTSAKLAVAMGLGTLAGDAAQNKLMEGPLGNAMVQAGIEARVSAGKMIVRTATVAAGAAVMAHLKGV